VFRATTFVGYIGCLTACKPHAFAVSINFRSCCAPQEGWKGVAREVCSSVWAGMCGSMAASLLVRRVLERDESFAAAVASLTSARLISPTFITVTGVRRGEGVCLTLDRKPAPKRGPQDMWLRNGPIVQVRLRQCCEAGGE